MVLYSRQSGTPLAALTLKATEDTGCLTMLTARPSLNEPTHFFQGMLNQPDKFFGLCISNLSPDSWIRFNILHLPNPHHDIEDQAGLSKLKRINSPNSTKPNQSNEIVADKSNGSRMMILSGRKETVLDPDSGEKKIVAVTVDDDEKKDSGPMGVYFYLSVQPEMSTETASKFSEGTVWRVVPGFVRKVIKPVPKPPAPSRGFGGGQRDGFFDDDEDCCGPPAASSFARVRVGSTQAGSLTYGSVVHVSTSTCTHKFDANKSSELAVLSMSIWEDMKFLPLPDIEHELETMTDDWIKNEHSALIESLNGVFKSDTCVIDLESKADTIICSCGHQCIHHSNVTEELVLCPMCRAPITAFVRVEDNFGYVGVAAETDPGESDDIFDLDHYDY